MEKANAYKHLSYRNVFAQFHDIRMKAIAIENDMPLDGKYVPKTDLVMSVFRFLGTVSLDTLLTSAIEIALYSILDGITSATDLESYQKNGFVDKTDAGVEVKPIEDVSINIGNFSIERNTEIRGDKLVVKDNVVKLSDVTSAIKGVELVDKFTVKGKDGNNVEVSRSNILTDNNGKVLIEDKMVVEIKGRDKDISMPGSIEAKVTDRNGRVLGVDRPATVGYMLIDVRSGQIEFRDHKFEHLAGEKLEINTGSIKFSADDRRMQEIDHSSVNGAFNDLIVEKIAPSQDDIDKKIEELDSHIDTLEKTIAYIDVSDTEKQELEAKIQELNEKKDALSSDTVQGNNIESRIEAADNKRILCREEDSKSSVEEKYKDQIDRIDDIIKEKVASEENKVKNEISNDEYKITPLTKEEIADVKEKGRTYDQIDDKHMVQLEYNSSDNKIIRTEMRMDASKDDPQI